MKKLVLYLFFISKCFKSTAQDTIKLYDVQDHIGQKVSFCAQVSDFDSRKDRTYLYFGGHYPNQVFSVIVNRANLGKHIKLKRDIMLGRKMVYFSGTIISYNEIPDTTSNYQTKTIKQDAEKDKSLTIGGIPYTGHFSYTPRTIPIDLKGKLVMIISDQKQIGKKHYPVIFSLY